MNMESNKHIICMSMFKKYYFLETLKQLPSWYAELISNPSTISGGLTEDKQKGYDIRKGSSKSIMKKRYSWIPLVSFLDQVVFDISMTFWLIMVCIFPKKSIKYETTVQKSAKWRLTSSHFEWHDFSPGTKNDHLMMTYGSVLLFVCKKDE